MSVRSLGAAASGIDTMQTDLDTIGNDIANSETDGFKSGTAEFQDLLTEQLQPAGAAPAPSRRAPTRQQSARAPRCRRSRRTSRRAQSPRRGSARMWQSRATASSWSVRTARPSTRGMATCRSTPTGISPPRAGAWCWAGRRASRPRHPRAAQCHRGIGRSPSGNAERRPRWQSSCRLDRSGERHDDDVRHAGQHRSRGLDVHPNRRGQHLEHEGLSPVRPQHCGPHPRPSFSGRTGGCRPSTVQPWARARPRWRSAPRPATTPGPVRPPSRLPGAGSENAVTQFATDQTIAVTSQDGYAAGTLDSYRSAPTERSRAPTPTVRVRHSGPSRWHSSPTRRDWTTWGTASTPRRLLRAAPSWVSPERTASDPSRAVPSRDRTSTWPPSSPTSLRRRPRTRRTPRSWTRRQPPSSRSFRCRSAGRVVVAPATLRHNGP